MRFFIVLFSILLILFSCRRSELTFTLPSDDYFLDKMKDGKWGEAESGENGNTLTIGGTNTYYFDDSMLGAGGIYSNGSGDYIAAVPSGDSLHTVTMNEDGKNALGQIMDIVGEENAAGVLLGLGSHVSSSDSSISDDRLQQIIGTKSVTEEERGKISELINSNRTNFTTYRKY